jgi:hypothetical protein
MLKKNLAFILIVLLILLLIALVLWVYRKRMDDLDRKMKGEPSVTFIKK